MEKVMYSAVKLDTDYVVGSNHAECLKNIKKHYVQGFIVCNDETGLDQRFVDRAEALTIAITGQQTITKHSPENMLLSEDLKDDDFYKFWIYGFLK
jgi:hypothetical protein